MASDPVVGLRLTASDPEPPMGSVVVDDCGITWENDGYRPCCWVRPDLRERGIHDPETWRKIAGNYGPVTVQQWGPAVTEAEIVECFRDTFADCIGWHEHHLANCVQLEVMRYTVTGEGSFESVLKCPHRAPMGYSRLPEEDEDE